MANIASQKKRIQRTARERLENRRRVSQVKTWFRRLPETVDGGDGARTDEEWRRRPRRAQRGESPPGGAAHPRRDKDSRAPQDRGPPPQGPRCPYPRRR